MRRWLPGALIGSLASLCVAAAVAWVSPRARLPVATAAAAPAAATAAPESEVTRDAAALRDLSRILTGDDQQISGLLRSITASAGQPATPAPPLPAIPPVAIPSAAPAPHATTGGSGAP